MDRDIRFNLLGTDRGASSTLDRVGNKAAAAHATFSRLGGILSGLPGPFSQVTAVTDNLSGAFEHISERGRRLATTMQGVGLGVAGLGALLTQVGAKDQQASAQLRDSITNLGLSYGDYKDEIEKAIRAQERFGHDAADTQDALNALTVALQDPKKALDEMGVAANIAAIKHVSLTEAANLLVKAHAGSTRVFKQFGMDVRAAADTTKELDKATREHTLAVNAEKVAQQALTDREDILRGKRKLTVADEIALRNAHDKLTAAQNRVKQATTALAAAQDAAKHPTAEMDHNIAELAKRLQGQASSASDTFSGKLRALKVRAEDFLASMSKYSPALMAVGSAMSVLGAAMDLLYARKIKQIAVDGALTVAEGRLAASEIAGAGAAGSEATAIGGLGARAAAAAGPLGAFAAGAAIGGPMFYKDAKKVVHGSNDLKNTLPLTGLGPVAPIVGIIGGLFGHNAAGTSNWRGGMTWVGERGPELVDLPAGSKVYDNGRSQAMAGNLSDITIAKLAAALAQAIGSPHLSLSHVSARQGARVAIAP